MLFFLKGTFTPLTAASVPVNMDDSLQTFVESHLQARQIFDDYLNVLNTLQIALINSISLLIVVAMGGP